MDEEVSFVEEIQSFIKPKREQSVGHVMEEIIPEEVNSTSTLERPRSRPRKDSQRRLSLKNQNPYMKMDSIQPRIQPQFIKSVTAAPKENVRKFEFAMSMEEPEQSLGASLNENPTESRERIRSLINKRRKLRQMAIHQSMNLPSNNDIRSSLKIKPSAYQIDEDQKRFSQTLTSSFFEKPKKNRNSVIVKNMRQRKRRRNRNDKMRFSVTNERLFMSSKGTIGSGISTRNTMFEKTHAEGNFRDAKIKNMFDPNDDKPSSISNKIENMISNKKQKPDFNQEREKNVSFGRISFQKNSPVPENQEEANETKRKSNKISIKIHNQNNIEVNGNNFQIFNRSSDPTVFKKKPTNAFSSNQTTQRKTDQLANTKSLEENDFSMDQVKVDLSKLKRPNQVYNSLGMIKKRRKKLSMVHH